MSNYGIPYKGNKSKIAEDILSALPSGKRLVDLFGGGFAITDCALRKFPNKWESFFYNDINPLLPELIEKAIGGYYSEKNFHPKWISRDEFNEQKTKDGYIAFIWSFGNNGQDYLYGRDIEEDKRKIFEYVVNGIPSDITEGVELLNTTIQSRRSEWTYKAKKSKAVIDRLQNLELLQSLSQLHSLSRLESLSRLDYRQYKYQDGDVIYCDIPYFEVGKNTYYTGEFDHEAFFDWAKRQPTTVYYSNYTEGAVVWQKEVRSTYNKGGDGAVYRQETLFAIGRYEKTEEPIRDYETNQISFDDYFRKESG